MGSVYALRSLAALWSDDFVQVFTDAEQALQLLPLEDILWRSSSLAASGSAHRLLGNARAAYKLLTEAQLLSEQSKYLIATLPTLNSLADVLVQQGKLQQAPGMSKVIERSSLLLMDNYEARTRLSGVYFEWDDLEEAEVHLQQVLAGDTLNEKGQPFAQSFLLLARIKQARGEVAQTQEIIHQLIEQSQRERFPIATEELQAYRAWWGLLAGEPDYALNWRSGLDLEATPNYTRERTYIILACVLVAQREPARRATTDRALASICTRTGTDRQRDNLARSQCACLLRARRDPTGAANNHTDPSARAAAGLQWYGY
ncbi:MAG: hypothetical protein H0U76_29425 [Ktedonobacteraceae bacterium]|nr:hypothetical protein [Ktedonobacteraceae bacterium]